MLQTMSFSSIPAVVKPSLLTTAAPRILSAFYYLLELFRLLVRGIVSVCAYVLQSTQICTSHQPADDSKPECQQLWQLESHITFKLTVVLDLDETLVLACRVNQVPGSVMINKLENVKLTCDTGNGRREKLIVFLRPGLKDFLHRLSVFAELILFSAAVGSYGNALLDLIDPTRTLFSRRLFRESTVCSGVYRYVKDLTKLGRDLNRTVIVDNRAFSFLLQPRNGIKCRAFRGDANDRELSSIILPLLESLSKLKDVRPILHTTFRMEKWFESKGLMMGTIPSFSSMSERC